MQRILVAALSASMPYTAYGVQLAKTSTVSDPVEDDICGLPSRLIFNQEMVSDNTLGQYKEAPAWKPHSIRFGNVFPFSEFNVDLVVSAVTTYFGSGENNRVSGDFAVISLNAGASVDLKFSFIDRITGVPVIVKPFYFSVANLGKFVDQFGGSKSFSVTGIDSYEVSEGTNITVVTSADGLNTTFTSAFNGDKEIPEQMAPRHDVMSPAALANSVTLQFPAIAEFDILLNVSAGMGDRNFHFGGTTNMVCEDRATCSSYTCPANFKNKLLVENVTCASSVCSDWIDASTCCEPKTPKECDSGMVLSFTNTTMKYANLGGFNTSLPDGIRFNDIFHYRISGHRVDLLIRNTTLYQRNPSGVPSGVIDTYLNIHVRANTSVGLVFDFVDAADVPVEIPFGFTLSVADFDTQINGDGQEQLEVDGLDSYKLTENTTIKAFDEGRTAFFTASETGTKEDNPTDVYNQTEAQMNKAVDIHFYKKTTTFHLKARVNGGWAGRQYMLAGWSDIVCPALGAFCHTFECPKGYAHRGDGTLRCAGLMCNEMDYDNCCAPLPNGVCSPQKRIQFIRDSLVHNNLGGVGPHDTLPMNMKIADVFPQGSKLIEMRLSVNGRYQTHDKLQPMNTLHGGFLKVDVLAGSLLSINLELIDMETGVMEPDEFLLTIAGLQQGIAGTGVQSVTASGFQYFNTSVNSSIKVSSFKDPRGFLQTKFTGSAHAPFPKDVPAAALHLDSHHLDKAVSLKYSAKSVANLDLAVSPGQGYRSFLIGGATRLGCPTHLALCNTMLCPPTHKLRATAAALSCARKTCSIGMDLDTCCEPMLHKLCDPSTALSLSKQNIMVSNLGGAGPDSGPPVLTYGDVFPLSGRDVDLVITNTTPYFPYDARANGIHNGFGAISMAANSSTSFEFKLIDRATSTPLDNMEPYALSLVDLQAKQDHITEVIDGQTTLSVPEAAEYFLSDRSFVRPSEGNTFNATPYGALPSAPRHPWRMGVNHLRNAVELKMTSSVFKVHSRVGEGHATQRRVLFTGPTNLACPVRAYCNSLACPKYMVPVDSANSTACAGAVCTAYDVMQCCRFMECEDYNLLDPVNVTYSNLGGHGPSTPTEDMPRISREAIVYGNVFPKSGTAPIDLVMSVEPGTDYFPNHAERNGHQGPYGLLNIRAGSSVDLRFTFIDAATGELRNPPKFFFTLSGVDQGDNGGVESVTITKAKWYTLPAGTALSEEEEVDESTGEVLSRTFTSTRTGGTEGSFFDPWSISGAILNHSVTLMMPPVERFRLKFSSTMDWTGRNLLFAGASSLVCGRKPSCSDFHCDNGFQLRRHAHTNFCSGKQCYQGVDHSTCCEVIEPVNTDLPASTAVHPPPTEEIPEDF